MICTNSPLVAHLERNNLFNFDKMVLGYMNTVRYLFNSTLYLFFKTIIADWEIFTELETTQNDNFWRR